MNNPYLSPYVNPYYQMPAIQTPQVSTPVVGQQNVLPPQQIMYANGKASIDALKLSPNSSVLIADSTAPIVWQCVSDSLGNVTSIPFDIVEHKSEEVKLQNDLMITVNNIDERLRKVEEYYEKSYVESNEQYESDKTDVGNVQKHGKSTANVKSDITKQQPTVQTAK